MRIAFATPNYWPYVRRGAERVVAEYARYLASAGHQVDIITTKPGGRRISSEGNITVYYERQINHPVLARGRSGFRFYAFSLTLLPYLLGRSYDVIHLWLYTNGLPVTLVRWLRGTPYVYQIMSATFVRPLRLDRWLFQRVALQADRLAALTPGGAARIAAELGVPVDVLPPCVDMETFHPCQQRDLDRPRVLFASDFGEYAKGVTLLLMAWDQIHRRCPEAVLVFAGPFGQVGIPPDQVHRMVHQFVRDPAARAGIQFVGEGSTAELPRRYAEASVTVLPSIEEAFGLVLAESLACGTPVVGNAHGGPGEIISDPAIGATIPLREPGDLLDSDKAGLLAEKVLFAIELARDPHTGARCREHARQWSRETVGAKLEGIYRDLAPGCARQAAGVAA